MVEEPRLHERDAELAAFGTAAEAHREALSAPGEAPRVHDVEIALLKGEETDDVVHGAEADANTDRSSVAFLDEDVHIAVSGAARVSGRLDVTEILQVFQAGLGGFQLDGVEPVARLERNLTADHLVLGLGVALDIHAADPVAGTLGDLVFHGNAVRAGVLDVRCHNRVRITARAVEAADRLDVVAHFRGGIGVASVECHGGIEFLGLENGHAAEAHAVHRVFLAFTDRDDQIHAAVADGIAANPRAAGAEVTVAAVVIEDGVEILVKLVGFEPAGLREPGEPALFLGFHLLFQLRGGEHRVAFEADPADFVLRTLVDHENEVGKAGLAGVLGAVADRHIRVTVALVVFLKVAAGFEDIGIAHCAAGLELGFLGEFLVGKDRVAHETDAVDGGTGEDIRDHPDAAARRLGEETDVIDQAGFEKGLDVVIETLGTVLGARLGGHQVADTRFVHRFGTAVADGDLRDVFTLEILRMELPGEGCGENHGE